ncbi:MAG TPA: hypothetical protein VKW06_16030 [Candidatus Angelobacter sp.]|nr:hypothetical protein [Candidatus Angelobacter sp.]
MQLILGFLVALSSSGLASAATSYTPTTTLAAETGNNTSAAGSFAAQSNGNIAGANVSKVPMRSLLYTASSSKIYAHFVPWFGFGDHMNVGYTSNDVAQVQKQVADMVSRGFDGAVVDWYGRGESNTNFVYYDQATQDLMHQAEQNSGFTFAVMEDVGALKTCATTSGCNVTQTMIADLNYANTTYFNSPAYLKFNGRPVVYFFGEEAYSIDWNLARSSVAGNPIFVFRNSGGFTSAQSNGGYSWVEPTQPSLTYLDGFYGVSTQYPSEYVTGSGYKGFNDTLAAWSANRVMPQNCGQTWLTSVAEAGKYYSAGTQMFGIQLVTWNDYEEGTEIETGIDNCVSVSASVSGTVAKWSISGQMNTVDHFSVYLSQDGQTLMWLADEPTSVSSLDLSSFGLPAGNYTVFVKAIGKPSLTNKMSGGAQVTLTGAPPPPATGLSLTAPNGTSATVAAGASANYGLQLSAAGGPATVTVACSGSVPDGACSVPSTSVTVIPGTPASLAITVSTTARAGAAPGPSSRNIPPAPWLLPIAGMLSLGSMVGWLASRRNLAGMASPVAMGVFAAARLARINGFGALLRAKKALLAPAGLLLGLALMTGCGGGSLSSKSSNQNPTSANGTPAGAYTLTVTATSGSLTQTQSLTLNVN